VLEKYTRERINALKQFDLHVFIYEWLVLLAVQQAHVCSVWQC
jgi:hypothetical protein